MPGILSLWPWLESGFERFVRQHPSIYHLWCISEPGRDRLSVRQISCPWPPAASPEFWHPLRRLTANGSLPKYRLYKAAFVAANTLTACQGTVLDVPLCLCFDLRSDSNANFSNKDFTRQTDAIVCLADEHLSLTSVTRPLNQHNVVMQCQKHSWLLIRTLHRWWYRQCQWDNAILKLAVYLFHHGQSQSCHFPDLHGCPKRFSSPSLNLCSSCSLVQLQEVMMKNPSSFSVSLRAWTYCALPSSVLFGFRLMASNVPLSMQTSKPLSSSEEFKKSTSWNQEKVAMTEHGLWFVC